MTGPDDDMQLSERIEAYLRNGMTADDRAAFERDMLRDPSLRARVELESRISDRLRAMYAPPAPQPLHLPTAPPVRPWVRLALGMAAAIVLVAVAGLYFSGLLARPGPTSADAVLARLESNLFEPAWACRNDPEFIRYTRDQFGQPFTIAPAADVRIVGWDYCSGVLGDHAGVLLVRLGETEKAMVFVDRKSHDRPVRVKPGSPLKVHRRQVGRAVLYEVNTRDQPVVLPLVNPAD